MREIHDLSVVSVDGKAHQPLASFVPSSDFAFQLPFREYPGREYEDFPLPPDYQVPAEWTFARTNCPGWGAFQHRGGA